MQKQSYFKMFGLNKSATIPQQQLASKIVTNVVGGHVGGIINDIGDVIPRFTRNAQSTEKYDDSLAGWLPGVGTYRLSRRRNQAAKLIGAKKNQAINQFLGTILTSLATGAAGAAIGHTVEGSGTGARIGGVIGAVAPQLIGALAAMISKKRSIQQQKNYEQNGTFSNYLIPGAGNYNNWKNLGFIFGKDYNKLRQESYKKNKKKNKQNPEHE